MRLKRRLDFEISYHLVSKKFTVSVIETHPLISTPLFRFLKTARTVKVGLNYPSIEDALNGTPKNVPTVLLIDWDLSQRSLAAAVRSIKANLRETKIAVLSGKHEVEWIFQAFKAGADGWFLKKESPAQLAQDIADLVGGGSPISAGAAKWLVANFRGLSDTKASGGLSIRELEIVRYLSLGLADKDIAATLRIALTTVNDHLKSVYRKLHVHSRAEAVAKYFASWNGR